MFVSMAPINIQMAAMEIVVSLICVLLAAEMWFNIEETLVAHRQCVD